MFDNLKKILEHVREISASIDNYKMMSPSGAMPVVAQVNKALKLIKTKKNEEAEIILLEAEETFGAHESIYRTLGLINELKKDFEKAAYYFQKALNLDPIKKELFIRLGYAQLSARLNEEALKTFEKAKKVFPLDSEILTGAGMALYRMEDFEQARIEFTKAFSIDGHNMNALFLTATIDVMLGDYERAETRLSLLVKVMPTPAHLYEYAKLKMLKQDYKNAKTYAKMSLKANRKFLPSYILLAEVSQIEFETEDALNWLQKAEEEELQSESLYLTKANICMFSEDFVSALESYEKVLEFEQSKTIDIKILICKILLDDIEDKDFIVEALLMDNETENNNERKAVGYMLGGVWNYKRQNYVQAEEYFRKALQITLKLPVVYYLLAKIYQQMNDAYKLDKYYNLTLEKNPYHFNAHKDFIEYLISVEKYEDARYKIKKALKYFKDNEMFENLLFYTDFCLLDEKTSEYNVKELIKLAEKLEKNSTFLYANEKQTLIERLNNF